MARLARLVVPVALGNAEFIAGLENILGRPTARRAPGRKRKSAADDQPLRL